MSDVHSLPHFIRRRKLTLALLAVSVVALSLLVASLDALFHIESRSLLFGLGLTSSGCQLTNGHLLIEKKGSTDEVSLEIKVAGNLSGESLSLRIPKGLELTETIIAQGLESNGDNIKDGERWLYYRFTDASNAQCWLKFQGDILTTTAQELLLLLQLHVAQGQREFPFRLAIRGLEKSDLLHLSPTPTYRSNWAVDYDPLPWDNLKSTPIMLTTRDRGRAYQKDFRAFLTGIFVGLFSSFLASIFWDLAREKELSWDKPPQAAKTADESPSPED